MSFDKLPIEIFETIFYTYDIKSLLNLQLVSKKFRTNVKKCLWLGTKVWLETDAIAFFVLNNFQFGNLNFAQDINLNPIIDLIKNRHMLDLRGTLDLSSAVVSDETIKKLNCCKLYLWETPGNIHSDAIDYLRQTGCDVIYQYQWSRID